MLAKCGEIYTQVCTHRSMHTGQKTVAVFRFEFVTATRKGFAVTRKPFAVPKKRFAVARKAFTV